LASALELADIISTLLKSISLQNNVRLHPACQIFYLNLEALKGPQ